MAFIYLKRFVFGLYFCLKWQEVTQDQIVSIRESHKGRCQLGERKPFFLAEDNSYWMVFSLRVLGCRKWGSILIRIRMRKTLLSDGLQEQQQHDLQSSSCRGDSRNISSALVTILNVKYKEKYIMHSLNLCRVLYLCIIRWLLKAVGFTGL